MTGADNFSLSQALHDALVSLFLQSDLIRLAILMVIVASAGWLMRDLRSIVTATILSLIVFAVASYAEGAFTAGHNAATFMTGGINWLVRLNIVAITAYAACFAALITGFHGLRATLRR